LVPKVNVFCATTTCERKNNIRRERSLGIELGENKK
jgi:hypothetical protein